MVKYVFATAPTFFCCFRGDFCENIFENYANCRYDELWDVSSSCIQLEDSSDLNIGW